MSQNEWNISLHNFFSVTSLNNNINPSVDLLIDSIDKFSFGENESITDKSDNISKEEAEKMKKISKNNFLHFKTENFDENLNNKLNDIEDIIIKNDEIKIDKKDNNDKICGLFTREDFNVKINSKHKHDQLNDSFEKKYKNPLEDLLNDDNNDNDDILNYEDYTKNNNNKKNESVTKSDNIETNKNINNNPNENNINENNNKEVNKKEEKINENNNNNDSEIKQIKSTDTEIPITENMLENLFPPINNKINENKNNNEKNNENKNENDNSKDNDLKNVEDHKSNEKCESPTLGGKEFIEKKQIDDITNKNNENNNNNDYFQNANKENISVDSNENKNNETNNSNNYEKQMNLPLSLNMDNSIPLSSKINDDSSRNHSNKIINYENNKNKNNEFFNNNELSELKENSFEIKNNLPLNISNINEDTNKKILELTEKLEKSEKDVKQIKEENLKLMEIVDFFKNLQGEIEIRKNFPKSGKNSRSETPKTQKIKKRCYTPTLSTRTKNFNNEKTSHHIKTHSYSKNNYNNDLEGSRLYIDYIPIRQKSYRELHGKDFIQKNQRTPKKKNNNRKKKENNYINRNVIYLTGSNNMIRCPYLNKNMNYFCYNNNNNSNINYHSLNNFYNNNNHIYNNFNNNQYQKILNNNTNYNNISQKQIMQLPYNEQPLFYESKPNFNSNNSNNSNNINNNINNNNLDILNNFSLNSFHYNNTDSQKINKNNISLYNIMNNKEKNNCKKRNKNKLLDFKDFQIIFEESEKDEINHVNSLNNEENKKTVEEENKKKEEENIININEKINSIKNNNDNNNINGRNNEKDNFWIDIGYSGNNEAVKKVKEDKAQKIDVKENLVNNNEISNDNIIINNEKEYMVPFYLMNTNEMFNNIINYHSRAKKLK